MAGRKIVVRRSLERRARGFRRGRYVVYSAAAFFSACLAWADEPGAMLLPFESANWRHLDIREEPADGWTGRDFDDSDWKQGAALLGYGDRSTIPV